MLADSKVSSIAPRVTVLMAVYNGLPFLKEAVASILEQNYDSFELLIVDDASTDASAAWVESVRDSRIRLIRNEHNKGQTSSLNRGLALARGTYVARLDQDDLNLPGRLKTQVEWLDKRPDMAAVGSLMIESSGRSRKLLGRQVDSYGTFIGLLLLGICPLVHPSVMFRRTVVTELGGYNEDFAPAEDVELWTRLAQARKLIGTIPEPLILYRVHAGQQSLVKRKTQKQNIQRAQARLIADVCPSERKKEVMRILSLDDSFWKYGEKNSMVDAFHALSKTIDQLTASLKMNKSEKYAMKKILRRWLGPGVDFAIRFARWPAFFWYPLVGLTSPLLIPRVRPVAAFLARPFRRQVAALRAKIHPVMIRRG